MGEIARTILYSGKKSLEENNSKRINILKKEDTILEIY